MLVLLTESFSLFAAKFGETQRPLDNGAYQRP